MKQIKANPVIRLRLFVIALSLWTLVAEAASVQSVRLWRAPDHTRLVFDLNQPAEHSLFSLENPDRIVLDLSNTSFKGDFDSLDLRDTPITRIRSAQRNQTDLRIVFDLRQGVNPRSFPLKDNDQYGNRLVLDLYDKYQEKKKTVSDAVATTSRDRDIIISIDAGHGGEDPGALGPGGIREKQVVLAISRALQALVDREPGFKAEMVRTSDYYIPLRGRTDIARDQRADLFVSIHADAFKNPAARGASVFALSASGATSETARYLAQRENQADLIGGVGNLKISDKDQMLAGVLLDLSMTATLNSSLDVGKHVLEQMGNIARLHKKHVEQAGFVVLKSPDIPSILVETGFISNPGEARQLADRAYQQRMAEAIFAGIRAYFYRSAPPGTWVAKNRGLEGDTPSVYVIARGDTLSGIAARYNVSVEALKRHNGMTSTDIRVGQRLKIPTT
ncbi:MAG: N-acetylmuramoyl-L-alanine amidase [Porticoccaceae bacterium]|nr:N-acetylmuramoyl-L-alanine amidase [Porticoccaceae bacterium]